MRVFLSAVVALGALGVSLAPARATPFHLQSINGVAINGASYNVSFFDLPFTSLPQPAPTFTTLAGALSALNAIVARPEYAAFAAQAFLPNSPYTSIVVPFSGARLRNSFRGDTTIVFDGVGVAGPAPTAQSANFELDAETNYNVAGISLVTFAAVPEPASMAVLAVGLFGAGLLRRRR